MIRSFQGKTPRIHPDAFVSEMAYVIGDVEIGPGTGVWPGAVIRADFSSIKIGADCQIEDNVVVHCGGGMEIGDRVIVGHNVVVHGKKIGSYVLLGNNSTILDGSIIGDRVVVGANALVSARMEVPDDSFVVGVPGEIRPLPERMGRRFTTGGPGPYGELVKLYNAQGLGSKSQEPSE